MRSGHTVFLLLAVSIPAFVGAARPQDDPNVKRGFDPASVYHFGDLDAVNLFNGHLTLRIPLGIRYPVGGDFSYQLTLQYNMPKWSAPGARGVRANGVFGPSVFFEVVESVEATRGTWCT